MHEVLVILGGGIWKDPTGRWRTVNLGEGGELFAGFNDRWRVVAAWHRWFADRSLILVASGGKGILRGHPTAPRVSEVIRRELEELGVPSTQIVEEYGDSTYKQLLGLATLFRESGIHGADIVTNEWHLPRVQAMFENLIAPTVYEGLSVRFVSAEEILLASDPEKWSQAVSSARRHPDLLKRVEAETKGLADIKAGCYRVPLSLRPATEGDSQNLFVWRNDPETRRSSVHTDPVPLKEHQVWLKCSLANPNRRLLIAESGRRAVGTVRLDFDPTEDTEHWELSWTVAPEARGQGFGREMVRAAIEQFSFAMKARIRVDNLASQKIATAAGFKLQTEEAGITHWVLP
jgi:RimJ/RimL family protein N-acetyltransferase